MTLGDRVAGHAGVTHGSDYRVGVTHGTDYKVEPYLDALRAAGVEPVSISPAQAGDGTWLGLDGLVLCGGTDINPGLYGEARVAEADFPEDDLDALELGLLSDALTRDVPVLAICRGMQLLNVAQGGSLRQHIPEWPVHRRYDTPKPEPVHGVRIVPGTRLAEIEGAEARVNSRHHQAVLRVADGLVVSAHAEDGVVEGLEMPARRFVVGVQWHPEDQAATDALQARLFQAFGDAVRLG